MEALPIKVRGFAKVAIFTTNVDAENQCLIYHNPEGLTNSIKNNFTMSKYVCGAMNRQFFVLLAVVLFRQRQF